MKLRNKKTGEIQECGLFLERKTCGEEYQLILLISILPMMIK